MPFHHFLNGAGKKVACFRAEGQHLTGRQTSEQIRRIGQAQRAAEGLGNKPDKIAMSHRMRPFIAQALAVNRRIIGRQTSGGQQAGIVE